MIRLVPYPGLAAPAGVAVTCTATRAGSVLRLTWQLQGELPLPAPAPPRRLHDLWELTCFECFLASPARPGYWEFNLSPAGHWNVYRFDGYRSGMVEERAFASLPFTFEGGLVSLAVDLAALGIGEAPWRLAIATVIAEPSGNQSFLAVAHPGSEPDFHHPEAFRIELPGPA
jgi:hypothetical protein